MCDEANVLKVTVVEYRFDAMVIDQMSFIKDLANPVLAQRIHRPPIMILALFKGPSVPTNPSDRQGIDADMSIDCEIGEYKEALDINTQGEGTPTISTSASVFTTKLVGVSSRPTHPTTTSTTLGFIVVPIDFVKYMFDKKDQTTARLVKVEVETSKLYQ